MITTNKGRLLHLLLLCTILSEPQISKPFVARLLLQLAAPFASWSFLTSDFSCSSICSVEQEKELPLSNHTYGRYPEKSRALGNSFLFWSSNFRWWFFRLFPLLQMKKCASWFHRSCASKVVLGFRDGGPFRGNGGPFAHGVDASVCHWWGLRCAFFHNDSVWSRCWRGQGNEWRLGRMQNLPRGWWWGLHGGPLLLQGQLEGKTRHHVSAIISRGTSFHSASVFSSMKHVRLESSKFVPKGAKACLG